MSTSTCAEERRQEPILVRVVDYSIDDGRENSTSYRFFTILLDPAEVFAVDLAATYTQRGGDRTGLRRAQDPPTRTPRRARSKSPDLVLQEIWGHLCCQYAVRSLMAQAATHSGHDPGRVSFVAALRSIRQTLAHPGAFLRTSTAATAPAGLTSCAASSAASTPSDASARHPASSNARTSSGTSNAPTTSQPHGIGTRHDRLARRCGQWTTNTGHSA